LSFKQSFFSHPSGHRPLISATIKTHAVFFTASARLCLKRGNFIGGYDFTILKLGKADKTIIGLKKPPRRV